MSRGIRAKASVTAMGANVIEFVWGRMNCAEMFDIARMKLMLRFSRPIRGVPMSLVAEVGILRNGVATRAWRVISADRAEAAFERFNRECDR